MGYAGAPSLVKVFIFYYIKYNILFLNRMFLRNLTYDTKDTHHHWSFIYSRRVIISLFKRFRIRRLPGDIVIKKENSSFYFPIVTCIVVSVVVSLILMFFRK